MVKLRVRFHFRVRGLLVTPDILGTAHTVPAGEGSATIVFPTTSTDVDEEELIEAELMKAVSFPADEIAPTPAAMLMTTGMKVSGGGYARVPVLRVDLRASTTIRSDELRMPIVDANTEAKHKQAQDLVNELHEIARTTVRRFLDASRVSGKQFWLGLSGEDPIGLGHTEVVDVDANQVMPVGLGLRVTRIMLVPAESMLTADRLVSVIAAVSRNQPPALAEGLLADAMYYASAAVPLDHTRALLISAIACEIKVKETLQRLVDPSAKALLEVLFENPRDWSLAAAQIFDKPAKAVTGRSLKEEDKDLFKRISQLFERRNRVAHRGASPTEAEANDGVNAAEGAFRWLATVGAGADASQADRT